MSVEQWDARYAASDLVWSAGPNRFVAAQLPDGPPRAGATAIDVACGEGRNAMWLAEQGWAVTAVDFSSVALDRARRLAGERGVAVDWRLVDVTAWEPDGVYDLVLIAYLHLPPQEMARVLEAAAGAVAAGGTMLAVGHHVDNLAHGHGGPPDPSVLWDPGAMAQRLDGLVVTRAERVEREVATDDGQAVALDALVRAHRRA